jgi:outer membrane protein insertion porin family
MEYYKLTYGGIYLRPITTSFTLRLRAALGYGAALGSGERLPFFKNFYGGGFGSVRGYKRNTLGPQDTPIFPGFTRSRPFGGNVKIESGAEIIFPVPFLKDKRSVQTAVFFDAGNIFDTDCSPVQTNCFSPDIGELRYAVGIGGTWLSGFGPITLSLGQAINDGPEDETEFFQFSLGQTF